MKVYEVVRDCVRMPFNPRRFKAGEIVEIEDNVDPGANFKLVDDKAPAKEEPGDGAKSLSELQTEQKNLADPKSGFAAKPENLKKKKDSRKTAK